MGLLASVSVEWTSPERNQNPEPGHYLSRGKCAAATLSVSATRPDVRELYRNLLQGGAPLFAYKGEGPSAAMAEDLNVFYEAPEVFPDLLVAVRAGDGKLHDDAVGHEAPPSGQDAAVGDLESRIRPVNWCE